MQDSCVLTYNTSGSNGTYAVAIQIEDFLTANSTTPLSSIPVQFLISIANTTSIADPPRLISDTPSNGSSFSVHAGDSFIAQLLAHSGGADVRSVTC